MKPPKCPFCGKEEWRHVCGVGDVKERLPQPKPEQVRKVDACEGCARLQIRVEELELELSEKKKGRAEYMKTYRAKKKDASPAE